MADSFQPLGDDESPMTGLFFVDRNIDPQLRVNLDPDRPLATGMCALVSSDGIVATCAHVVLAMDGWPGQRLTLFGASPSTGVEVQAQVCAEGWRGPTLDEHGARPRSLYWEELWDARPDVFRQDIAFLRILPDTARWHERGPASARTHETARDELVGGARVLPVCRAGYRRPGTLLSAWCVSWIQGAPDCHPAHAEFRSFDEEGHHAVRVATRSFRPGFSGSALWDAHRRVVVGVVRRALPAMGDLVLATDGLALTAHPSVRLSPDGRLQALERHLGSALANAWPERYEDMGGGGVDHVYIEPQLVRIQGIEDPLKERAAEPAVPAVEYLADNLTALRRIVIRGAAGIGKSLLLRRLAAALLARAGQAPGSRLVPIVLTASEFSKGGANIEACLNVVWASARLLGMKDEVIDVIAENGATLALFVDGVDEVASSEHAALLARLDIRRSSHGTVVPLQGHSGFDPYIAATLVTTRPSESWEATGQAGNPFARTRLNLFELLRFDRDRIDAFCAQAVRDDRARERFRTELRRVRWANDKATPLQLRMARSVFAWLGKLPDRSIDLTALFVDRAMDQARNEFTARHGRPLRDEVRDLYLPHLPEILGLLADASLGGSGVLSEQRFLDAFQSMKTRRGFRWAVNPGSLSEFLYRDFRPFLALLVSRTEASDIEWAHRTFAELLSAQHALLMHESTDALRSCFFEVLKDGSHGPALSLLGVIDRANDEVTAEDILRRCMSEGAPGSRPQLFALRALGAGLDAKGRTRRSQVRLLVRHLVTDVRERMMCAHVFLQDDLPDATELLRHEELQDDLFDVMLDRFKPRLARATSTRPAVVLAREALILKHANLWPRFLDMGLRRPLSDDPPLIVDGALSSTPARGSDDNQAGIARVLLRSANGSSKAVTIPAADFVASIAEVARRTPADTPVAELVEFVLELRLGDDGQIGP